MNFVIFLCVQIHQTINELYGKFLETSTVVPPSPSSTSSLHCLSSRKRRCDHGDDNESGNHIENKSKYIVVKYKKNSRRMSSKRLCTRKNYYTKFVLKKENYVSCTRWWFLHFTIEIKFVLKSIIL